MIDTENRHIADYKEKWGGKQKMQLKENGIILQRFLYEGF